MRVSFNKNPTNGTVNELQEDEYYSFGLRNSLANNLNNNRYLYNGKEVQTDLTNQYDYGARLYDPVIARWGGIDELSETFREISSYAYVLNNPIILTDPDGRDTIHLKEVRISAPNTQPGPPPTFEPLTPIEPIPPIPFITLGPILTGAGIFVYLVVLPQNSLSDHSENDALRKRAYRLYLAKLKDLADLKKKGKFRGVTGGKNGKPGTEVYDINGEDYNDALQDFHDLAGVTRQISGGLVGTTIDGKTINVRDHSSEPNNAPTIEIYNPATRTIEVKFRYNP